MPRSIPLLALGLALGFSAAAFFVVNPPPAFRMIRYDESMAAVFQATHLKYDDPCANQSGDDAKYMACRKAHFRRSGKPAAPEAKPRYKMADPFWDRA